MKKIYQSMIFTGALLALSTGAMAQTGSSSGALSGVANTGISAGSSASSDSFVGTSNTDVDTSTNLTTEQVRNLQTALIKRGYKVPTDGIFETSTETSLRAFQRENKLPETGTLDPITQKIFTLTSNDRVVGEKPAR